MASKMLIDAAHPEETRVVVVRGNRVEEFDYESASKKQLRGNIYLAKVTRVEPSLQAAFVDYGGNRHGFLAFTEIHPDYYQIPVADRQALLEEEAAEQSRALAEEAAEDEAGTSGRRRRRGRRGRGRRRGQEQASAQPVAPVSIARFEIEDEIDTTPKDEPGSNVAMEASDLVQEVSEPAREGGEPREDSEADILELTAPSELNEEDEEDGEQAEIVGQPVATKEDNGEIVAEAVESVGSEDVLEEVPERTRLRRRRPYKIQEVIRRRQIIL
ncbi:MAG TPA: ribonuclease E/G, partial [Methylomirabilota bacterium]|nr:ribonuclease E/G [Methylomirabilota bacterium]